MPVGVGSSPASSHQKKPLNQNKIQSKGMILLAKISYNDPDSNTNVLPNFTPNCTPGNHFKNFKQTHNSLTNLLVYLVFFY